MGEHSLVTTREPEGIRSLPSLNSVGCDGLSICTSREPFDCEDVPRPTRAQSIRPYVFGTRLHSPQGMLHFPWHPPTGCAALDFVPQCEPSPRIPFIPSPGTNCLEILTVVASDKYFHPIHVHRICGRLDPGMRTILLQNHTGSHVSSVDGFLSSTSRCTRRCASCTRREPSRIYRLANNC